MAETDPMAGMMKGAVEMSKRLGLPAKFLFVLLGDDDWTFVIKCHALLESSSTFLLSRVLGRPEIQDALAGVDMSDKLKMISGLDLLSSDVRGGARALSTLRNKLVHRVENADFTFSAWLSDQGRRNQFIKDFGWVWDDAVKDTHTADDPKLSLWLVIVQFVSWAQLELDRMELEQKHAELKDLRSAHMEDLWKSLSSNLPGITSPPPLPAVSEGS